MGGIPFEGVVFDMDGTLFDTERLSRDTWLEVGAELGWPQPGREHALFTGLNRAAIAQKLAGRYGPDFPVEQFLDTCTRRELEHMEREGVPFKAGAREILAFLREEGVPIALATSTYLERAKHRLALAGILDAFRAVVTGDQVTRGKPDPEIFQAACRALGTTPERTLAVEDSPNGVRSAHAAGMPTVMIPDMIPPTPEVEGLLYRRFDSLLQLRDFLEGKG